MLITGGGNCGSSPAGTPAITRLPTPQGLHQDPLAGRAHSAADATGTRVMRRDRPGGRTARHRFRFTRGLPLTATKADGL